LVVERELDFLLNFHYKIAVESYGENCLTGWKDASEEILGRQH
jgi:hypothetical protein